MDATWSTTAPSFTTRWDNPGTAVTCTGIQLPLSGWQPLAKSSDIFISTLSFPGLPGNEVQLLKGCYKHHVFLGIIFLQRKQEILKKLHTSKHYQFLWTQAWLDFLTGTGPARNRDCLVVYRTLNLWARRKWDQRKTLATKNINQIKNWCLLISGCCSLLNITRICVVPRIMSPSTDTCLLTFIECTVIFDCLTKGNHIQVELR